MEGKVCGEKLGVYGQDFQSEDSLDSEKLHLLQV